MNPIEKLTKLEYARQRDSLNLIASENYPSPKALALMGSIWSTKYAEGYPGKRYYAGNVNTDELEAFVQGKALEVFDPTGEYGVNIQVLSGSPANAMVYLAMLEPGDKILSLSLANGGHLSHLHATSNYKKFFEHDTYDVKEVGENSFEIDLDGYRKKLASYKPKLVIIGFSSYPRAYQFQEMCELAHKAGALVLADIAHINGLVATGLHDTPFKVGAAGADFVSMTTHKTMRGPRGAMLFAKQEYMDVINKTIFPGTSGGPHLQQIAAIGQSLLEILGEEAYPDKVDFATYSQRVLDVCKALEEGAAGAGLQVISPTQTHLCLIKLPDATDSLEFQRELEAIGVITNRNVIPFDTKTPFRPSGMRLGSAALASRGLDVAGAKELGMIIGELATKKVADAEAAKRVQTLVAKLAWYYPEP